MLTTTNARRQFIRTAALTTCAVIFPTVDHCRREQQDVSPDIKPKRPPVLTVGLQAAAVFVGNIVLTKVMKSLGVPVDNVGLRSTGDDLTQAQRIKLEELLLNQPQKVYNKVLFAALIKAPLLEEALFRALPSIFADKKSVDWTIGALSTVMFSAIHAINREESPDGKIKYKPCKSLPVSQAILGMFCWHLHRNYGFSSSVLGHFLNNSVPVLLGIIGLSMEHEKLKLTEACSNEGKLPSEAVLYAFSKLFKADLRSE